MMFEVMRRNRFCVCARSSASVRRAFVWVIQHEEDRE